MQLFIVVEFLVSFYGLYAHLACEDWMNGVFFLLYVSLIDVPRWVSHGLKVETKTIMLFNFSEKVLLLIYMYWSSLAYCEGICVAYKPASM